MQQYHPHEVREHVFSLLTTLNPQPDCVRGETILFRNNKYCGHRYRLGDFLAVWELQESRIVVFNATGRPLRNLTVEQLLQTQERSSERKAA